MSDPTAKGITTLHRRSFLRGFAGGALALGIPLPRFARAAVPPPQTEFDLTIDQTKLTIDGRVDKAITINGSMPGPLLHWREGDEVTLRVHNRLRESTSIHWHGILLPFQMDGVPGVSFEGIPPGDSFTYRFPVTQAGTYWYHSHTGFQEQRGLAGPIVISPREPSPQVVDREYVLVLTDYTFMRPERVMALLKKSSGFFNFQKRTVIDALTARDGMTMEQTLMWGRMRMEPTDIADVTGSTYNYLMNGIGNVPGWFGQFEPGERVRLRIVNASAMTHFDLRIPGLPMTVIEADGQPVQPVEVDELRIAVAETFDVIVQTSDEPAYTLFAETMDRSGYALGTLGVREGLTGEVPPRRKRPLLTMADMGMSMDHGDMPGMAEGMDHGKMDHASMGHDMEQPAGPDLASLGPVPPHEPGGKHGPLNIAVAQQPRRLVDKPGPGLRDAPHRVLVYSDLVAPEPYLPGLTADRDIELHLTGHMERYGWSFNGKPFEQEPYLHLQLGEVVRLVFVNDTMMSHPIHLHGMWMYLENGRGELRPRKHTIDVRPAERITALVHVDAPGDWAFHCHLQYHMDQGMFRIVRVSEGGTT